MKPTFIIEIIHEGTSIYIICDDCEMYTTEQIETATGNTWDTMQKRARRHGIESKKVLANTSRKTKFFDEAKEKQRVMDDRELYRKWYVLNGQKGTSLYRRDGTVASVKPLTKFELEHC